MGSLWFGRQSLCVPSQAQASAAPAGKSPWSTGPSDAPARNHTGNLLRGAVLQAVFTLEKRLERVVRLHVGFAEEPALVLPPRHRIGLHESVPFWIETVSLAFRIWSLTFLWECRARVILRQGS